MGAGDFRSRVGFYKRPTVTEVPDYGNTEGEYPSTPEFTCAANIRPRLGGENVLAGRLTGTNLVNVTVRNWSATQAVDTSWMLKDERADVQYQIRSIIDPNENGPEHGRFFEMLCEKGVAT